jgi:hypothetical protein
MHLKKMRAFTLGLSISAALYLGYFQDKDKPLDYARDVLDLTSKVLVLLDQVSNKKDEQKVE